jgi:ribosomal protein S18 acetylase RimI-like enzyme
VLVGYGRVTPPSPISAQLELAGADRLQDVRALWLALHHHHRHVVGSLPLVENDEDSWVRRKELYRARLSSGDGFLVLASVSGEVAGYAFVCLEDGPDDTFRVGERYAEIYSLSVAESARGQGIGTRLLDFVDWELARRGVAETKIAVMAGNEAAQRLYERRGFRLAESVLYRFGPR